MAARAADLVFVPGPARELTSLDVLDLLDLLDLVQLLDPVDEGVGGDPPPPEGVAPRAARGRRLGL